MTLTLPEVPCPLERRPTAGDVVLTGGTARTPRSRLIKIGAALRGLPKPWYSHAALVVDGHHQLAAEALTAGVRVRPLWTHYRADDVVVLPVSELLSPEDLEQVLGYAADVVADETGYGFVTFAALALYCLTGIDVAIQARGTAICSGFVAQALERAGWSWERPAGAMMPSDLLAQWNRPSVRPSLAAGVAID